MSRRFVLFLNLILSMLLVFSCNEKNRRSKSRKRVDVAIRSDSVVELEQAIDKLEDVSYRSLLADAVALGRLESVKYLLQRSDLSNYPNAENLLISAVKSGSIDIVKVLLEVKEIKDAMDKIDSSNQTALTSALKSKRYDIATYLLKVGTNLHLHVENLASELRIAIYKREYSLANELVNVIGDDIGVTDMLGNTILHRAVVGRSTELIENIVSRMSTEQMNIKNELEETALLVAIKKGAAGFASLLLDTGAMDLSLVDKSGNTALHLAVLGDDMEFVDIVIRCMNIDQINIENSSGETALIRAINNDKYNSALLIVDMVGAEACSCIGDVNTHLRVAIGKQAYYFASVLLEKLEDLVDLSLVYRGGNTLLHRAVLAGDWQLVNSIIIRMDQDKIDIENRSGETALMLAIKDKKYGIANMMIDSGADASSMIQEFRNSYFALASEDETLFENILSRVDLEDDEAKSYVLGALLSAINREMYSSVVRLASLVDMSITSSFGNTALHLLAGYGHIEPLTKVIDRVDIDILNAKNEFEETALMIAIRLKNYDFTKALVDYGQQLDGEFRSEAKILANRYWEEDKIEEIFEE